MPCAALFRVLEMGLLESVHYFIYAMLAYRLGELAKTGQSDFEEFQSIFSGSSQKGIDSLVRSLAATGGAMVETHSSRSFYSRRYKGHREYAQRSSREC